MGAQEFMDFFEGTDVNTAFADAVDAALYDYGHASYTGTIAEKDDFTVIQQEPVTSEESLALARRLLEEDDPRISDKWGPAGAIAVKDDRHSGWLFFGWASS